MLPNIRPQIIYTIYLLNNKVYKNCFDLLLYLSPSLQLYIFTVLVGLSISHPGILKLFFGHRLVFICCLGKPYWGQLGYFPHEASCRSTLYHISFFLALSNWCACPFAHRARGLGVKKWWEWRGGRFSGSRYAFTESFWRGPMGSTSASSDKHTSDATGRATKK